MPEPELVQIQVGERKPWHSGTPRVGEHLLANHPATGEPIYALCRLVDGDRITLALPAEAFGG